MLRAIKLNNKIKESIIISIILHFTVFGMLIIKNIIDNNRHATMLMAHINMPTVINAVIAKPDLITKYSNNHQQYRKQTDTKDVKEYYRVLEKYTVRYEPLNKTKGNLLPVKETEQNKKRTNTIENLITKFKTPKILVSKEAKRKAQIKEALITKNKKISIFNINDLFSDLLKSNDNPAQTFVIKKNYATSTTDIGSIINNRDTLSIDINNYANKIRTAIESHFYDASLYTGKTCTLKIRLAPDGMLLNVNAEEGDNMLCAAALAAARMANIPKPPSQEIYEIFKNIPLYFKP